MKKKCTKKKLTAEQKAAQLKKRKVLAFRKKIRSSFTDAGFTYFSTLDKHFPIGTRTVELDYLFLYENIIVICEDNTKQKKDIDHIRNKNESFAEIRNNKTAFLNWLSNTFPEKATMVKQYRPERYFLYYIYISQTELEITEDEKNRYSNLLFWDPETLSYFNRMAQCIQHSARYEIFRYLGLKNDEIGFSGSEGGKTTIKAPIIYPQEATGLRNGVRVVSFMMSAEKLLRTSYVLRKDSWEESMFLYQRLIEKDKVKSIRAFLAQKGEAFYNNIIVALPDNVTFEDDAGTPILVENIGDFQHCKLVLPDEMNSIDKEMFRSKKQEIEDRVAKLTEEIKGLQPEKEQTSNEDYSVKLLELRERLKEYTGFDYSVIPESIVEAFIERIWVSKDEFRWYLRTGNNADSEFDPDDHIKIGAFTLTINDAKKYIYSFSTRRRVYKWADLNVSVWI